MSLKNRIIDDATLSSKLFDISTRDTQSVINQRKDDLLFAQVIRWQLAKKRAGTHSTKEISDVSGTTKKPYAQKGTGRARQGSLRGPHQRTGAVAFGPHPRDHAHDMPKQKIKVAVKRALIRKYVQQEIVIADNLEIQEGKTKAFLGLIKDLNLEPVKTLFIVDKEGAGYTNLKRGSNNLEHYKLIDYHGINLFDLLRFRRVVMDKATLPKLEELLYGNRIEESTYGA